MYNANPQKGIRQGFKHDKSSKKAKSANGGPAGSGKVYCSNSKGKAPAASFGDADSFLGSPNDSKLTPGNKGNNSTPAKGKRSPLPASVKKGGKSAKLPNKPGSIDAGHTRYTKRTRK